MAFTKLIAQIFRDYIVEGVPASGKHKPVKSEIRAWGAQAEALINAQLAAGGRVYASRASILADLNHNANTGAWIIGDATAAYNGVYRKNGAAGSGTWVRESDLPFAVLALEVTGGTANALVATSPLPLPVGDRTALFLLTPSVANTGAATIEINGTDFTITGAAGEPLAANYLRAGAAMALIRVGSQLRTLNDFRIEALAIAADTSADAAAASQAAALASETAAASSAASGASQASAAAVSATTASAAAGAAQTAESNAVAAASASGPAVIYDSKADATSALSGLSNGTVVEVLQDESRSNTRTRYRVTAGALVYKVTLADTGAVFASIPHVSAAHVSGAITTIMTLNRATAGDGGGARLIRKTASLPLYVTDAGGGQWSLDPTQPYTPEMFAALGDGAADDTTPLRAFAAALAAGYNGVLTAGRTYKITDTVTFAAGAHLDFSGAAVLYAGPRDRPAIVHGSPGVINGATISGVRIRSAVLDWGNIEFVGLRVINLSRGQLYVDYIDKFCVALDQYSEGQGYTQSTHRLMSLRNARYAQLMTTVGASSYINENTHIGGDYTNDSDTLGLGNCYSIRMRALSGGYVGNNGNRWYGPCFQPGDGNAGDERIPVWLDNVGAFNVIERARYESGRGPFARIDAATNQWLMFNDFSALTVEGLYVEARIAESGTARYNTFSRALSTQSRKNCASFDLPSAVYAWDDAHAAATGELHVADSTGVPQSNVYSHNHIVARRDSIEIASASPNIGFFVEVTPGDAYTAHSIGEANFEGRVYVSLYNSDWQQLTSGADVMASYIGGGVLVNWTPSYGGAYYFGGAKDPLPFKIVASSAARYARIFVGMGGTVARVKTLSIERFTARDEPLRVVQRDGLVRQQRIVSNPVNGGLGTYQRGELLPYAAAAASGSSYWQCIADGRLAQAWVASTAYPAGHLISNSGNIYVCTTAGTTAASGGPTGTASSISDGTAVWAYLTPRATFALR